MNNMVVPGFDVVFLMLVICSALALDVNKS